MKIIKKQENKLLSRIEVKAVIDTNNGSTMKREEVKKMLAKELKVDEKLVIINKVTSYFGKNELNVIAKVYDDEKALGINARPHMVKRNTAEVKKEEAEA